MTKQKIISKVKSLNFPAGSYVVFGSAPMAMAGIREAQDIDLLVSKKLFLQLRETGWKEVHKNADDIPVIRDVFEAHENWNFSSYSPTLDDLLKTALIFEGIPFASLEEVRKWKVSSGRPKDLADIELIDAYFKNRRVASGIYEHFKGNQYEVIGIARHSETLEEMVVYRALYGEHALWVRPLTMFTDEVEKEGVKVLRFRYVEE